MPKVCSWHSIRQLVHHNNTRCTEGNAIESRYRQRGTGGKPLCQHCDKLNQEEKKSLHDMVAKTRA